MLSVTPTIHIYIYICSFIYLVIRTFTGSQATVAANPSASNRLQTQPKPLHGAPKSLRATRQRGSRRSCRVSKKLSPWHSNGRASTTSKSFQLSGCEQNMLLAANHNNNEQKPTRHQTFDQGQRAGGPLDESIQTCGVESKTRPFRQTLRLLLVLIAAASLVCMEGRHNQRPCRPKSTPWKGRGNSEHVLLPPSQTLAEGNSNQWWRHEKENALPPAIPEERALPTSIQDRNQSTPPAEG